MRGAFIKKKDPKAWMITFSDLLILLLTFFVLLLSMSTLDHQRLRGTLRPFFSAARAMEVGSQRSIGKRYIVHPKVKMAEGRLNLNKKASATEMKPGKVIGLKGKLDIHMFPIMDLAREAFGDIKGEERKKRPLNFEETLSFKGIDVEILGEKTILRVSSHLLFESGSAELHLEGLEFLVWLADRLRDSPYSMEVEGHTDNRPISTKRFPSNWELSLARSVNVVRFLEEKGAIPGSRLSASGYADLRPLFPNNTVAGREKNRRVEVVLKRAHH